MTAAAMKQFQRQRIPAPGVHPLVLWIWKQMNFQRASQEDVAKRAGVSSSAMRKWRKGNRTPNLCDIEAVINVLGGKIIVRIADGKDATQPEGKQ